MKNVRKKGKALELLVRKDLQEVSLGENNKTQNSLYCATFYGRKKGNNNIYLHFLGLA